LVKSTRRSTLQWKRPSTNLRSVQEGKGPKVQKDLAKRTALDRLKTGRASTHPVILNTAAQRARQTNAEPPIRTPPPPPPQPSRFATSFATFPGEGHGENWHPHNSYGQDPQYEKLWSDQCRSDSYNHPTPQQDFRRWDGHMPLQYGHHPSSPYTSSLHVPPREPPRNDFQGPQQTSSSSIHFRDFHTFSDFCSTSRPTGKIKNLFILITLPATEGNNWRGNFVCNTNKVLFCYIRCHLRF
jgi:hypothetical protein